MKENEILVSRYGLPITVHSFQAIEDDGKKQGFQYGWLNDELTIHN